MQQEVNFEKEKYGESFSDLEIKIEEQIEQISKLIVYIEKNNVNIPDWIIDIKEEYK